MDANDLRGELDYDSFREIMRVLNNLTHTEQIAEFVGCSEEIVRKRMFKLEDEDEVVSKLNGAGGRIWAKKS